MFEYAYSIGKPPCCLTLLMQFTLIFLKGSVRFRIKLMIMKSVLTGGDFSFDKQCFSGG